MLIEEIRVQGYKSLVDATLHVRPLTLLAGTNSSGKSSIMQPLLLIKQTMEAPYNPAGALILNGPHVQAETAGELVSKGIDNKKMSIYLGGRNINNKEPARHSSIMLNYQQVGVNFTFNHQLVEFGDDTLLLKPDSSSDDIENQLSKNLKNIVLGDEKWTAKSDLVDGFLDIIFDNIGDRRRITLSFSTAPAYSIATIMHIPGLRNKPERSYPATLFTRRVKGTVDLYAASTISQWQQENNTAALAQLNNYLQRLGLTNAVTAKVKNANEVELSVNRLPSASKAKPRKADMVNIADVGIGVSQVLPILVALIAAQEGQIVYVEQPELHLHPRAQVAMGELLAEAANRSVRVIVETHSSLLLLTVQTLIAQGKIANTDVGLHWFTRDAKGASQVQYVQPDEDGAYGEWPEDFSEIELKAQDAYLTAVGLRQFGEAAQ